jgi:hypothetical protein
MLGEAGWRGHALMSRWQGRGRPGLPVRPLVRAIFLAVAGFGHAGWRMSARSPGKGVPEMIIDCAHYQDGRRHGEGAVPLEEAAARCGQGGFVWLGLFEPGAEELAPTFVITVRQGVASELRGARQRLEQRPELLAAGSASALWAILDQVVDGYAPVVAGLERDIDQIEATVFSGAVAPTERIYSLRREATDFYRAVHPLLGVVATIERAAAPELQPYLRDVQDHLLLVNEEVAAHRDLLGTVLEANMAVISVEQTKVSVRQNATIEQLTILATVFLPLTFVTGFFGQNFAWLVGRIHGLAAFLVYGIGGLALPLVLLFLWLRLRRPHPATGPALHDN